MHVTPEGIIVGFVLALPTYFMWDYVITPRVAFLWLRVHGRS
jgi:hypothetical protein